MNVIIVDDEPLALCSLVKKLETVVPDGVLRGFSGPTEALAAIRAEAADVAFLDISMFGMSGMQLALRFKEECPGVNIIFVTAYPEYALEALKVRASGYILKPATEEAVRDELENLRTPVPAQRRVVVRTFGTFEVFVDGKPVHFARSKSKELFALLIDRRGSGETAASLCSLLWPDKPYDFSRQRQLQTVISEMMRTFTGSNEKNLFWRWRNFLAVNVERVDCDLYRLLQGDTRALNTYAGLYMTNYSWAKLPVLP